MNETSTTVTLTIRIDSKIKEDLEKFADSSNRSITDSVVKSIKDTIYNNCHSCGRNLMYNIAPGITKSFQDWVVSLFPREPKEVVVAYVSIEVQRQDGRRAYFGRVVRDYVLRDGTFNIEIDVDNTMRYLYTVPIPISEIVAWRADNINGTTLVGDTFTKWVQLGDLNGNELVRRSLLALGSPTQTQPSPQRGQRPLRPPGNTGATKRK